ncbi:MAG: hypothetical protein ACUVXG_11935 [Anaerolineae bacterium]
MSAEEKERVHGRALDVLETVGVKFNSHRALDILEATGCPVDRSVLLMTANFLSTVVLFQLKQPGLGIIWGGAPTVLDMHSGLAAAGVEAVLMAVARVGRRIHLSWASPASSPALSMRNGMLSRA